MLVYRRAMTGRLDFCIAASNAQHEDACIRRDSPKRNCCDLGEIAIVGISETLSPRHRHINLRK